jgi:hypothetical protein
MQPDVLQFWEGDSCGQAVILIFARALKLEGSCETISTDCYDLWDDLTRWDNRRMVSFGKHYIKVTDNGSLATSPAMALITTTDGRCS